MSIQSGSHRTRSQDIAIIGMSGLFPGAPNLEQFWTNLRDGVESISFFGKEELAEAGIDPAALNHPRYVNAGGVLAEADMFDATFFGLNPREAEAIDPQQRVFLECAWHALEDAGCVPGDERIGVFAGCAMSSYMFQLYRNLAFVELAGYFQILIGNDKDYPCKIFPEPAPERKHDAGIRRRRAGPDRAASIGAAACAGDAGHASHGSAGLIASADRKSAPSFWLLPLMALWANLHGGFVFGLVLIAPVGLDAVVNAEPGDRKSLVLRWAAFALAALAAGCCTPYGWNAILAARKILALGDALPLIMEWKPADFGSLGALEICLLLGIGLALFRGIKLPPLRIVLLLGLLHMALSQGRAGEMLALLAPLVLAAPLARQIGGAEVSNTAPPARGVLFAGVAALLVAATVLVTSVHRFEPHTHGSPVAAVAALKKYNFSRVFNDYDFGGYLIENGVAPFIDGRTELYGEKFFVDHNAASGLMEPENLFRLLEQYKIEATLMRTQSAATKLLDHIDGWQKVYADDIATIHVRKPGAAHTIEPVVNPAAK